MPISSANNHTASPKAMPRRASSVLLEISAVERAHRRAERVMHECRCDRKLATVETTTDDAGRQNLRRNLVRVLTLAALLPVSRVVLAGGRLRRLTVDCMRPCTLRLAHGPGAGQPADRPRENPGQHYRCLCKPLPNLQHVAYRPETEPRWSIVS